MKKILALLLSAVLLCSVLPLQVFAREIKYFDFLPKRTKYLEHTSGHYNEDNPDEYIYDIRFVPGDIVRITAFDNNETDYTCVHNGETGELEFRAETGDVITLDELHITTSQEYGDRWFYMDGEDNHHEFTVELEGKEATASLEIVKNTVTNITFMQGEQRRYRFETDGEWKTDGQGQPYFHYALQYVSAGDMLIVGKEGVDYFYEAVWSEQEQQFYFRDEAGTDTIDVGPGGIEFEDKQASEPFSIGADNYYTVRYMGKSYDIQVVIDAASGGSILGAVNAEKIHHALTVALYEGETQVQQQELSSSETFRFDNLHPGTYTIQITGVCVPTITLTGLTVTENTPLVLTESSNEQLRVLHIAEGDVTGDGWIDIGDVTGILAEGVYGNAAGESAYHAVTDVNADGTIDIDDVAVVLQEGNYGAGNRAY